MTRPDRARRVDVLIVGAGPTGLACAQALARQGIPAEVVDRAPQLGGVPAYTAHLGFGRHLRRVMTGPRYARVLIERAADAGAALRAETSVIGWADDGQAAVDVTSPGGRERIDAHAVVLATGCRERPRHARLVPGTRPAGVLTTGRLQQAVEHYPAGRAQIGERAVVVGAEHVSFSAVATLAAAGCATAAVVTDLPRHQTFAALRLATALRGARLRTTSRVTAIRGRHRVEAVEVTDLVTGAVDRIGCDTVVFTGGWAAENELARLGGVRVASGSSAPSVDGNLRTSRPGVFAAGNLVHPAESADAAARAGHACARAVTVFLDRPEMWRGPGEVGLEVAPPLLWVTPDALGMTAAWSALAHAVLRTGEFAGGRLTARQGDRVLWHGRPQRFVPNRSIRMPLAPAGRADAGDGPVVVSLDGLRAGRRRLRTTTTPGATGRLDAQR